MKKKWLMALVVCMYAIQIIFVCMCCVPDGSGYDNITNVFTGLILFFIALSLIFVIINILCAIKMHGKKLLPDEGRNTFKVVMLFKSALIPFYIANYVLWLIVAIFSLNPFLFILGGWVLWIAIFLATLYAYATLLATSSYNIAQIIVLKQRKVFTLVECVVHIALHLIFVADVADSIYLYVKYKGQPNLRGNALL